MTDTEHRAARMVKLAREMATRQMGSSAHLLTADVRKAIVCKALVAIFAGQDESIVANIGPIFHKACEMISGEEE